LTFEHNREDIWFLWEQDAATIEQGVTKTNLLTAVADSPERDAEKTIRGLLGHGWYVFRSRPLFIRLKPEDRLAFYRKQVGVVAEAVVAGLPEKNRIKWEWFTDSGLFSLAVRVKDVRYFFDGPVVIDAKLRARLDVFRARRYPTWAWFVQSARSVSDHDFDVLVGRDRSQGAVVRAGKVSANAKRKLRDADEGYCSECGAPWKGRWCESCGLYKPCARCGARTELGGRCPKCGASIFDDLVRP
jgi:hypothetical protein